MTLGLADQNSASAPNLSALAWMLHQSCLELMADYGVSATPQKWQVTSAAPSSLLIAEAEFVGASLRGTLALSAPRAVILETARGACGMHTGVPRSLPDWNRELVNQLLGRVKNKLRTQDVSVDVGVPAPLAGVEALERSYDVRQCYSCTAGTFSILLAVVFEPGLVIGEGSVDDDLPSEGELLLF
jgi:hypothetical protein